MYTTVSASSNEALVIWDGTIQVVTFGDRGILGLSVDPDYPASPFIYVLMSVNRVAADGTANILSAPATVSDIN